MKHTPSPTVSRTTWILLAHRAGARLFTSSLAASRSPSSDVDVVRAEYEFEYPAGHARNHDLETDDRGTRTSHTGGQASRQSGGGPAHQAKHGLDPQEAATEHHARVFAKRLANYLEAGRSQNRFDDLILAAEPRFLGQLRRAIDRTTAKQVVIALPKNLLGDPEHALLPQLRKLVIECRESRGSPAPFPAPDAALPGPPLARSNRKIA